MTSYGGGVLVIDEPRREVTVRGEAAELTPTEWGILVALATVPGRVYSRYELINRVRGYEFEGLRADRRFAREEPAPQDRGRSRRSADRADRAGRRVPARPGPR